VELIIHVELILLVYFVHAHN